MRCDRESGARNSSGFTLLEIVLVLFLLGGLLSLIIPRMSIGDNLGSVGRRWVGNLKSFQEMSIANQKTVRLYIDLDRGMYWPMVQHGHEEKPPLDPVWAIPISLPESIRFADIQVGSVYRNSGRAELFFYPNGRIETATMHFTDSGNNVMGIRIEPTTALIRMIDQRFEPTKPWTIPDRLRPLLQTVPMGSQPVFPIGVAK